MVLYVPLRPLQIMTNFCKFHRASDSVLAIKGVPTHFRTGVRNALKKVQFFLTWFFLS